MISFKPKPEYLLFLFVCLAYWAVKLLAINYRVPVFITSWFSDFLAIPFIMLLFRIVIGFFENDYRNKALPIYFIATAVVVYSVWFEWYLPNQNTVYIGDWIDVLAYVAGGLCFFLFEKWRFKKKV